MNKTIFENPKITDTIVFDIETPNAEGCFTSNPYKVDRIIIYYIERDYIKANYGKYEKKTYNEDLLEKTNIAERLACESPTEENILNATELRSELESSAFKTNFLFKDRSPIEVIGSSSNPVWLSTDTSEALISEKKDSDGNPITGHFTFEWTPSGVVREGDFFICWTWTPLIAGDSLSAHMPFFLTGDPRVVTTVPSHITPEDKYDILLERYLPEMYKMILCEGDITPQTLDKLNQSVSKGFKFLEDFTNQIIDLYDANALHESLLVYLSNLFNVKLKSDDPTLWRRQIKQAISLFKKKGTLEGLQEAFAQSGMTLNKITQYWQITSSYTWQESFKVSDSLVFELENEVILPIDENNFKLWVRKLGEDVYEEYSSDYVSFSEDNYVYSMTWIGEDLSVNPLALAVGDIVRVKYSIKEIPDESEQQLEDYIQRLPLSDQRDEADQNYPPKNWNVHLIEEDDILFDIIVPVRHPFHDPLVFGQIRTEFPYSENIYNMEEYNGSIRDSYDPCFIDKEFIDPCGSCLSSSITADVAIENISNDRLVEAQDVLNEYTPFHAVTHSINFSGEVNEFVQSPVETIQTLILMNQTDFILSGKNNPFFHRVLEDGLTAEGMISRSDLATQSTISSGNIGTGYNERISIITPDVNIGDLGVISGNHILEILSPSPNSGTYMIDQIQKNTARVITSVTEPLDETLFTFKLSNILYSNTSTDITQDNLFKFTDSSLSFSELGVKSSWDIANTDYSGGAWKLRIPAYSSTYIINDVLPNGILILTDDGSLPSVDTSSISYSLLDGDDNVIGSSTTGSLDITLRAFVELNDAYLLDRSEIFQAGDYLYYDDSEYEIKYFSGNDFWIEGYDDGNAVSIEIEIRKVLLDQEVGLFGYKGTELITASNHETGLGIVNGANPLSEDNTTDDSKFKENYLIRIGDNYFKIEYIDSTKMILSGLDQTWKTLTAGGTSVEYDILHFEKDPVTIDFTAFSHIDRDGHDVVVQEIEDSSDESTTISALQNDANGGIQENISQEENITFTIERIDGSTEEGEL